MRDAVLLCLIAAVGCSDGAKAPRAAPNDSLAVQPAAVIDSVLPMDVMLARFRARIPEVKSLAHGQPTRDSLVGSVVRSIMSQDTAQLEKDAVSVSEFAWLYFPTSVNAKPPYELPPGLAWFRIQEDARSGVLRALQKFRGHQIAYEGYSCGPAPTVEGPNRVWIHCVINLSVDGQPTVPIKLFSSILERDGRFVVLSYKNDF